MPNIFYETPNTSENGNDFSLCPHTSTKRKTVKKENMSYKHSQYLMSFKASVILHAWTPRTCAKCYS